MKYLLDMDGVITDFVGSVGDALGLDFSELDNWDMASHVGLSNNEFWGRVDGLGEEFWSNMKELPWADEVINILGVNNFIVSTSPTLSADSTAGKVKWLKKKFGPKYNNFMVGKWKWLMAESGLTLIDDREDTTRKFQVLGGTAVLFPRPWNSLRNKNPVEYLRRSIKR